MCMGTYVHMCARARTHTHLVGTLRVLSSPSIVSFCRLQDIRQFISSLFSLCHIENKTEQQLGAKIISRPRKSHCLLLENIPFQLLWCPSLKFSSRNHFKSLQILQLWWCVFPSYEPFWEQRQCTGYKIAQSHTFNCHLYIKKATFQKCFL